MTDETTSTTSVADAPAAGYLMCNADLVYREEQTTLPCALCSEEFSSLASCANGHFVCDRRHSLGALELNQRYRTTTDATDPVDMALQLMRQPAVKMHGPETTT